MWLLKRTAKRGRMGVCALRRGLTAASKPNQPFLGCCDGSGGLWRARGESASAPLSRTRLRDHVPSAALSWGVGFDGICLRR